MSDSANPIDGQAESINEALSVISDRLYAGQISSVSVERRLPAKYWIYSQLAGVLWATLLWLFYLFTEVAGSSGNRPLTVLSFDFCIATIIVPLFAILASDKPHWSGFLASLAAGLIFWDFLGRLNGGYFLPISSTANSDAALLVPLILFSLLAVFTSALAMREANKRVFAVQVVEDRRKFDVICYRDEADADNMLESLRRALTERSRAGDSGATRSLRQL